MTGRQSLTLLLLIGTVCLLLAPHAWGLPSFARKYGTSCATCHEAFPRLNAVGEGFRLNGLKFMDDELYRKIEPTELGDEAYKKVWPKAIWPSDIPGLPPVSVFLKSDAKVDLGGSQDVTSDFVFPNSGKLLGAGALGDQMSMLFEVAFANGDAESTQVSLEGWMQLEDILGLENVLNLRLGTVGMQEMGFFTARDHNRLSVNPYLYSTWSMPGGTGEAAHGHGAPVLLDEDHADEGAHEESEDQHDGEPTDAHDDDAAAEFEGNPFIVHAQPGVEVNGFGRRWRYALGVVNGGGHGVNDVNAAKDVYLQLAYKLGGLSFDGSGREEGDSLASAESWRDDSFTFSAFGYRGTGIVNADGVQNEDDFLRAGGSFQAKMRDLTVGGGYLFGRNDSPYGQLSHSAVDSHTWYAEAYYFLYAWLIPYMRYEALQLDLPMDVPGLSPNQDRVRLIASVKALLRANVALAVEGRLALTDERLEDTNNEDQLVFSLTSAF